MKKNIYIGDIHGRDNWKQIVDEHDDADNITFVGDYLDSFNLNGTIQLHNIKEIVEYKKFRELDPSKKVYLLIGNHDIHYMPGILHIGGTSGFQAPLLPAFKAFFIENQEHFQMCVLIGNNLCTHAGVSNLYLRDEGFYIQDSPIDVFLNDLFKYKPNRFTFDAIYDKLNSCTPNGYGDDIEQSPLWIRPRSLQRANKDSHLKKEYIQIVGHTAQSTIDIKGKTTGGRYYYIDTLDKKEPEYLVEIDNAFNTGYLEAQSPRKEKDEER